MPDQVEFLLQNRTRGLIEAGLEFTRNDRRERRLAQPWRTVQQHMVEGLAPLFGRLDRDRQVLLELRLTGEIGETFGP